MDNNFRHLLNMVGRQAVEISGLYNSFGLAISGGLDSTVLFDIFRNLAKIGKVPNFFLAHVNFGLRGAESDLDEAYVRDLAQEAEVEVLTLSKADIPALKKGESVQVWARKIRRDWFLQLSKDRNCGIVLAHHQNDLVENVLLRIGKGAGPAHLLGMQRHNPPFWRPLLPISRSDLENYAQHQGLRARKDSSNDKLIYERNKVRLKVIPVLEEVFPQIGRKLVSLGSDCQQLSQFIERNVVDVFFKTDQKTLCLDQILDLPEPIFMAAIRRLCIENGWINPRLNRLQLSKIFERIMQHKGLSGRRNSLTWPLSSGYYLVFENSKLSLRHGPD